MVSSRSSGSSVAVEEVEIVQVGDDWLSKSDWQEQRQTIQHEEFNLEAMDHFPPQHPVPPSANGLNRASSLTTSEKYARWSSPHNPALGRRSARFIQMSPEEPPPLPIHPYPPPVSRSSRASSSKSSSISYTSGGGEYHAHPSPIQSILQPLPPHPPPPMRSPPQPPIRQDTMTTVDSAIGIMPEDMVLASNENETVLDAGGTQHPVRVVESGGNALVDARRALFGAHRRAEKRLYWILPTDHDSRVTGLLSWIDRMSWALATLGVHKFLSTRTRGALVTNADYRPDGQPAVDWITFQDAQKTFDPTLQQSIASYDPGSTTLVFAFLVSKSMNSLGIWRRKLAVPHQIQVDYSFPLEDVKSAVPTKDFMIHVEANPPELPAGKIIYPPSIHPTTSIVRSRVSHVTTPDLAPLATPQSMGSAGSITVESLAEPLPPKPKKPSKWKKFFKFKWGRSKKKKDSSR